MADPHRKLPLLAIKAKNFRSLADVNVSFGPFNVLIGPNGSGKSNLLRVLRFVRDTASQDIPGAIDRAGGLDRILRQADDVRSMSVTIEGAVTENSKKTARDSYKLTLTDTGEAVARSETFMFKRVKGQGRRYQMSAEGVDVKVETSPTESPKALRLTSGDVSALGALARVEDEDLGNGPREFFSFLSSIRYLDPKVEDARLEDRMGSATLNDRASNLSVALHSLSLNAPDSFEALKEDLSQCLPGLQDIDFKVRGGSTTTMVAQLHESGLRHPIDLADASFGTVRMLALLTALHEENPPAITVIEEVDHGLHPYALDVLVERMREASNRTQIIVASHSPTLVNRLHPDEMIICDRNSHSGESIIPALTTEEITAALEAAGGFGAGELWFSGALRGVPQP